ncbi:MAG: class I SAM-dependent methyltransferase [Desulfobacteraceae bacterium]|jgi:tRNA (cmo5U34)-methyltransferase
MNDNFNEKSTVDQIRRRFDKDVDRFSNLDSGQEAAMDAPVMMALTTEAALAASPHAVRMLDIGCGAGNYTLKILQSKTDMHCELVDLSGPMLERAYQRVTAAGSGEVRIFQGDIREVALPQASYDIIIAAAVLHHLRGEDDWQHVFKKLYALCAPGGSLWIIDLIRHRSPSIQAVMEAHYGRYLDSVGGSEYRKKVMAVIDQEDSPQTLPFQLNLLRQVGFTQVELLHKNGCFASFGGIKKIDVTEAHRCSISKRSCS